MPGKPISFNNLNGISLSGILDVPDGPVQAYALFAHCFTCSKNLKAANNISRALNEAGIAVLRFDFTGLGHSEGDFADTNFSSNVADLHAAVDFLSNEYIAPAILIGHSLGGTAMLQAAPDIPSAVAVVAIASPSQPSHVAALLESSRHEIESTGQATVDLGGRPFTIKKQFLDDLERHSVVESVAGLRKALLVMHAPLDAVVEIQNASDLFLHAKHPKSFISLDDADHLLNRAEDSRYAGALIASWAAKYLPAQQGVPHGATADNNDGLVVAETKNGVFRTDMNVAGHKMLADEPISYGGTNLGPSPYDLLSAALASCTSMTLQVYAKHKKLALDAATVTVKHEKIHAKDCDDCESQSGKVDRFERLIALEGDLSDAQRQRCLEIADRCPVHRTLEGKIQIVSELET